MTATYEKIASTTTTGSATTVTFSTIPATYTDLVLISNAGAVVNGADLRMRINGDTGNNYSDTYLWGSGSTAGSARASNQSRFSLTYYGTLPSGSTSRATIITQIMNYSNSTTYKTCLTRANNAASGTDAIAHLWRNTNAITSISLLELGLSGFTDGSTFTLYGIKAE
jgi:hypothetical protein